LASLPHLPSASIVRLYHYPATLRKEKLRLR
jgi:hypothetical protein